VTAALPLSYPELLIGWGKIPFGGFMFTQLTKALGFVMKNMFHDLTQNYGQ
jgi:hypothetical protein